MELSVSDGEGVDLRNCVRGAHERVLSQRQQCAGGWGEGLTLVHISAQTVLVIEVTATRSIHFPAHHEPVLSLNLTSLAIEVLTTTEKSSVLHCSSQQVLTLTWDVDECKPLDGGQVEVTLAMGQGGTTKELHPENRNPWRIEDVAAEEGFDLMEVLPFEAMAYDGYEPRRVGP